MTTQRLKLDPLQETRIRRALQNHKGVCLTVTPATADTPDGEDTGVWLLSPRQLKRLSSGNGGPVKVTFSNAQLHQNLNHTGGFLPLLAAAILPIIGSAIGGVVEREIAKGGALNVDDDTGPSVISHSPAGTVQISPQGTGLYLNPYMGKRPRGYGLWSNSGRTVSKGDLQKGWGNSHIRLLKTIL